MHSSHSSVGEILYMVCLTSAMITSLPHLVEKKTCSRETADGPKLFLPMKSKIVCIFCYTHNTDAVMREMGALIAGKSFPN